jgi:hypothetical protein
MGASYALNGGLMRLFIAGSVVAVSALMLTARTARADATPTGVELGLRTGYSLPFGDVAGGGNASLSDAINGVLPIWLDAGYRFNPNMYVGANFQYGIAFLNTSKPPCNASGVSCSGSDLMFGIDFHYHLMPDQTIDPWGGVGVGYEILNASFSQGGQSAGVNYNGFQFFNLQVGADYKAMPNLGIGPFVMFSLGQYSNCGFSGALSMGSCSIQNTALHEWLTFGIRGAYDINL